MLSIGVWFLIMRFMLFSFLSLGLLGEKVNDVMRDVAGHTHSDSQPAAISILDGPSEVCGHIAYFHGDAFTCTQLKLTSTNRQVVNHQTGCQWRNIK